MAGAADTPHLSLLTNGTCAAGARAELASWQR